MTANVLVYETWLSFRSAILSHLTKRNLKTRLQIYPEPQPCFIHFVSGSLFTLVLAYNKILSHLSLVILY